MKNFKNEKYYLCFTNYAKEENGIPFRCSVVRVNKITGEPKLIKNFFAKDYKNSEEKINTFKNSAQQIIEKLKKVGAIDEPSWDILLSNKYNTDTIYKDPKRFEFLPLNKYLENRFRPYIEILNNHKVQFTIQNYYTILINNTDVILDFSNDYYGDLIIFLVSKYEQIYEDVEWDNNVPCFVNMEDNAYYVRNCFNGDFEGNLKNILPYILFRQRNIKLSELNKIIGNTV